MRIKQLAYLLAVVECKSITKASQKLFISHQAVSHALQSLEKDLQTTLFNRTPHGVTLTADGEYVVEMAQQILSLHAQLEEHFGQRTAEDRTGSLKIAGVSTFVSCILPQVQVQFIKKYPHVELTLLRTNVDPIVDALCERRMDLGFLPLTRIEGQAENHLPPELVFTPLSQFQYNVVIGQNSPLVNYKTLSVKSLLRYPIVFLEEQVNNDLASYIPFRILSHFGQPQVIIANSSQLYCKLIAENMGISFSVTDSFLNHMITHKQFVYKPLRDKIDGYMGYLLHRDNLNNPLVQCFLEVFNQCYPHQQSDWTNPTEKSAD